MISACEAAGAAAALIRLACPTAIATQLASLPHSCWHSLATLIPEAAWASLARLLVDFSHTRHPEPQLPSL